MFLGLLGGCAGGVGTLPPASYQGGAPDYVIGSGDLLEIFVWDETELSTEVRVRPDGKITVPLVDDLQASGKTPNQLAVDIEKILKSYVAEPVVSVKVNEFVGRYSEQIRVVGQAATPQALPYRGGMTLLDVMIAVGGLTEFAAGNRATIVRGAGNEQKRFGVKLEDLLSKGDITANVDMQPGDVLIIPEAWF
jgi:polysaccharide export outer membrane protein